MQAADDHDASVIVMRSHGPTGLARVLLGGVATASSHDDRPVPIVHAAAADRAA